MKVRFYLTRSGRSPVEEFLAELNDDLREDFQFAIRSLDVGEKLNFPLNRNLNSIAVGLNELRLKNRAGIYRFFYFIRKTDGIYFLHAFKKTTQEIPKKEIALVLRRLKEVQNAV